MELSQDTAAKKLDRKRFRQVLLSIPRYAREVSHVRTPRQFYQWFYYKPPYAFPLAEFPSRVNLEPTNDCNLACKHCPRTLSVTHRGLGYMDPELFPKIAAEIAQHPDCTVKIVGLGEPALHPQLGELMDLLTRHPTRRRRSAKCAIPNAATSGASSTFIGTERWPLCGY
jgi:hypothetical protein